VTSIVDGAPTLRTGGNDGWVRAWPLRKPALFILAGGGAVLLAVWTAVGLFYMAFLDDGAVGDADRDAARWLADRRTPTWNSLTHYGSMLSDTLVKVTLVAVVGGAMVILWRRWHDGVFLVVAVSLEAAVFVITSFIVDRERPPVEQLDSIPPSGSFPSGHTGAAVAFYGGVFVIMCWHTRNRVVRSVFGFIAVVAPLIVGASRAYRGMHHPIDVAAGLLLGVATILIVRAALAAGVDEIDRTADASVPARVRRLDLTAPDPVASGDPVPVSGAPR
jgi:membrane-associated phospholipid phosphatase